VKTLELLHSDQKVKTRTTKEKCRDEEEKSRTDKNKCGRDALLWETRPGEILNRMVGSIQSIEEMQSDRKTPGLGCHDATGALNTAVSTAGGTW